MPEYEHQTHTDREGRPEGRPSADEQRPPEPDPVLRDSVDTARATLLEAVSDGAVGSFVGYRVDGPLALSLQFECLLDGYPGWLWTVSLARTEDGGPTVLETELLAGETSLLAPPWVPWSERLAEYRAQQKEAALREQRDEEESAAAKPDRSGESAGSGESAETDDAGPHDVDPDDADPGDAELDDPESDDPGSDDPGSDDPDGAPKSRSRQRVASKADGDEGSSGGSHDGDYSSEQEPTDAGSGGDEHDSRRSRRRRRRGSRRRRPRGRKRGD